MPHRPSWEPLPRIFGLSRLPTLQRVRQCQRSMSTRGLGSRSPARLLETWRTPEDHLKSTGHRNATIVAGFASDYS
jgi:hypothetical protein